MREYRAIFFDWDGTAVYGRKAPTNDIAARMRPLLDRGVYLVIVSGTTYENIGGGCLHESFTPAQLKYLKLGLARGAYNYDFNPEGKIRLLNRRGTDRDKLLAVHDAAYDLHRTLLADYGYVTDIVFSRPNYCKLDLLSGVSRGEALFLQDGELQEVKTALERAGFSGGLRGLMALAVETGKRHGVTVRPTCDAKYLEVGLTTKSDNVDFLMERVLRPAGVLANECCFWGDEFLELDDAVWGSDAFMITPHTRGGDFFDVGSAEGNRPGGVARLGGGVERFLEFLSEQAKE